MKILGLFFSSNILLLLILYVNTYLAASLFLLILKNIRILDLISFRTYYNKKILI